MGTSISIRAPFSGIRKPSTPQILRFDPPTEVAVLFAESTFAWNEKGDPPTSGLAASMGQKSKFLTSDISVVSGIVMG